MSLQPANNYSHSFTWAAQTAKPQFFSFSVTCNTAPRKVSLRGGPVMLVSARLKST